MISSKYEHVFFHTLSDHTSQIIFNTWWASVNVWSQHPLAWSNSRHVPSWQFYLHCGVEKTGSPGIICSGCHQVICHPSEYATSSMVNQWLPKAHITKVNELTELEVSELTNSTVAETALPILERQGSQGITIVSLPRRFIFDIYIWSILTEMTDKTLQTGIEGHSNYRISPRLQESQPHITISFN